MLTALDVDHVGQRVNREILRAGLEVMAGLLLPLLTLGEYEAEDPMDSTGAAIGQSLPGQTSQGGMDKALRPTGSLLGQLRCDLGASFRQTNP